MNELIQKLSEHNYCLSLLDRVDKKTRSEEVFAEQGMAVEFIPAISGENYETTGRMLDNYKAQNQGMINIFLDAIANQYKSILIMEDDIEFTPDAFQVLSGSLERTTERVYLVDDETKPIYAFDMDTMLQTEEVKGYEQKEVTEMAAHLPDDWSLFTLGCRSRVHPATLENGNVWRLRQADLGTCWFFKENTYQDMIDELAQMTLPYDVCISKLISDFDKYSSYAILCKGVAYQRVGYSDNLCKDVDNSEVD